MLMSSLGAQGPFRAHLAVQTVNLVVMATRGICFCDSQVLSCRHQAVSALPGEHVHMAVPEHGCISS